MTMLRRLALKWRERQSALGYKGKQADRAVFEYFIGATAALQLAGHLEADHVGTCAAFVLATAAFPIRTVEKWANADLPEALPASGAGPAPAEAVK